MILIVENEPADIELITNSLTQGENPNELHLVETSAEALQFLCRDGAHKLAPRPDLVLVNMNGPGVDGRELLVRVKADPLLRRIPVVVLTTTESEQEVLSAYSEQANGYIRKPDNKDEFARIVRTIGEYWLSTVELPPSPSLPPPALDAPEFDAPLSAAKLSELRILVVEDSDTDARILAAALDVALDAPLELEVAARLSEAITRLTSQNFDVVLCDLGLSDSQGLATFRGLRKFAPSTPFVVLTGTSDDELGAEALRAGAQDYLVKGEIQATALRRSVRYAIDRQTLLSQLLVAQRQQVMGEIAGAVAHDFNNLLTVIQANSALIGEVDAHEVVDLTEEIGAAVQRASHLTRQLLAFGKRHSLEVQTLDLNQLVNSSSKLFERVLTDAQIVLDLDPLLPRIIADPAMLEQLLMNLALNSRDAMSSGGTFQLETRAVVIVDKAEVRAVDNGSYAGQFVRLRICDTGIGIQPAHQARIWEPFFSTKRAERGSGLGLSTVLRIVQQHRGFVTLDSALGKGTTFDLYFPVDSPERQHASRRPDEPTAEALPLTILLVDDELAIQKSAKRVLTGDGHTVLVASSAEKALALFEAHKSTIQLVLTDLHMPEGMGGRELARILVERGARVPIVYASGYAEPTLSEFGPFERAPSESAAGPSSVNPNFIQRGLNFIEKPYAPAELRRIVRRAYTTFISAHSQR